MCGIAGIILKEGPVPRDALERMQKALVHRGPDDQGVLIENNVGLVHTRLSIIDIEGGQQPLHMSNAGLSLIANGEIYNYPEIRGRFQEAGFQFASRSDCEVILPLYERYGDQCVDHLRGMFSFCLYDRPNSKLYFARDRMGEKPFYYFVDGAKFIFASELRALLASGLVPKKINERAIGRYYRYQYVPEPETPFLNVSKLKSASYMTLDLSQWTTKVSQYWDAFDVDPIEDNPHERIRYAVEDSISSSLISDVPIGLSLSGGLDSSLLACLMRKYTDRPLNAISIGYADAGEVDERPQARSLAAALNLDFHDVEVGDDEMIDRFPEMVMKRDDLIGDISGFNYFRIMEHAREQDIPVMLQGHGVDEMYWGYPWVKQSVDKNESDRKINIGKYLEKKFPWLRIKEIIRDAMSLNASDRQFLFYELQPYTSWIMSHAGAVFTSNFVDNSLVLDPIKSSDYGELNMRVDLEATRLIMDLYLRENGITQGDRLSMANSVEMRLPFVDYKFIETVIGLRKANRDDHLPVKQMLKDSVRDLLPDEVLNRPKKGFSPPVTRWHKRLREQYGELLQDGQLVGHGILAPDVCRQMAAEVIRSPEKSTISRMTITLELWMRGIM